MADLTHDLDAYAKPPDDIKRTYKAFQKLGQTALESHPDILDMRQGNTPSPLVRASKLFELPVDIIQVSMNFLQDHEHASVASMSAQRNPPQVYEIITVPGKSQFSIALQYTSEKGRALHLS